MISNFPEPDVFTLNCPTQQILDVVANKWTVIVMYCLAYGPRRYSEIQRRIEGISQKVLTQTLRRLERHGLVKRRVLSVQPTTVEYSLSELGEGLLDPLFAIANWSRQYFPNIVEARNQYDQKL
ncbi:MAG: winged helix-turn-helix transcriptional regulator [Leptolyngbyaceae cyanobacterium]